MRGGGFSSRWSEMSVSISCQNKSASTSCQADISCGYTHLLPEVSQGVIGLAQGSAWVVVALYFPATLQVIT